MEPVDLSEFYAMSTTRTCRIGMALESASKQQRAKLEGALATDSGRIPHAVIVRWIEQNVKETPPTSPDAVSRHRKGQCSCARS